MFNTVNFTLQNYINRVENRTSFAQGKVSISVNRDWGVEEEEFSLFRCVFEAHECLAESLLLRKAQNECN